MFNVDFNLNKIRNFYEENSKTVRMAALIIVVGLSILFFWIHGDSRTHVISENGDVTEETAEAAEPESMEEVVEEASEEEVKE